jgi:hypothetical protein
MNTFEWVDATSVEQARAPGRERNAVVPRPAASISGPDERGIGGPGGS